MIATELIVFILYICCNCGSIDGQGIIVSYRTLVDALMPRFSFLYGMLKVVVIASMNISMCHIIHPIMMVFFWRGGTKRKKIFRLLVFCVVALIERPSNEFAD